MATNGLQTETQDACYHVPKEGEHRFGRNRIPSEANLCDFYIRFKNK